MIMPFLLSLACASKEVALPKPDVPIDTEDSGLLRKYSQDDEYLNVKGMQKFLTQFDETKDEAKASKRWNYAARFFGAASAVGLAYTLVGKDFTTQQRLEGGGAALGAFALGYLSLIISDNYLMEAVLTYNQAVLNIEYWIDI